MRTTGTVCYSGVKPAVPGTCVAFKKQMLTSHYTVERTKSRISVCSPAGNSVCRTPAGRQTPATKGRKKNLRDVDSVFRLDKICRMMNVLSSSRRAPCLFFFNLDRQKISKHVSYQVKSGRSLTFYPQKPTSIECTKKDEMSKFVSSKTSDQMQKRKKFKVWKWDFIWAEIEIDVAGFPRGNRRERDISAFLWLQRDSNQWCR